MLRAGDCESALLCYFFSKHRSVNIAQGLQHDDLTWSKNQQMLWFKNLSWGLRRWPLLREVHPNVADLYIRWVVAKSCTTKRMLEPPTKSWDVKTTVFNWFGFRWSIHSINKLNGSWHDRPAWSVWSLFTISRSFSKETRGFTQLHPRIFIMVHDHRSPSFCA